MARKNTSVATASLAALLIGGTALTGCSSPSPAGDDPTGDDTAAEDSQNPSTSPSAPADASDRDLADAKLDVTWQDALKTAQQSFDGDPVEISLDWERDEFAYTVSLVSATEEYEAEISATTGDIVADSSEALEDDDVTEAQAEVFDPSGLIDVDEAISTALAEVDGTVTEWSLDRSSRGLRYEVNIDPAGGGDDVEVGIDAKSGKVQGVDR